MEGKNAAEKTRAIQIIERLLKFRNRSEQEMRLRLRKHRIPEGVVDQIIKDLKRSHIVDDRQFTKDWINSRLRKPFGFRRIFIELKKKGINDGLINEELKAASNAINEEEIVRDIAKKRLPYYKNCQRLTAKRRLYEYLTRRGFSLSIIQKVIQDLFSHDDNE